MPPKHQKRFFYHPTLTLLKTNEKVKDITYVLVYVDDILVTGSNVNEVPSLITKLNHSFALKDLGEISGFLGIQVTHTADGFHLSQRKYISNLLCKSKMQYAKGLTTPTDTG